MAAPQVTNEQIKEKKGRRRRKKRRTEDFSDSSSSSSSLSDEDTHMDESKQNDENETEAAIETIEEPTYDAKKSTAPEPLTLEQQRHLQRIKLTTTAPTQGINNRNIDMEAAKSTINSDRETLENEYLKFMASSFSEDLDELRKKPDFTDKSLVLLAKTLQSGGSLFDENELKALLEH
ncbi:hypothetical protein QFC19_006547 [Naganishia cerealis]|uniref:Uncharacterized protein n=1 Tax=Naganishia cerealis TaxID=610337 RepID=A0ACC2VGE5_9TREE|nr:hypothetical protein QFC19_006547 [Naganishia cerealis]